MRGTVYEINLDHRYIRAIEHGVNLRDQSGKSILALPGELIDSDNIWIRRGREFLDTSWETFNSLSDTQLLLDRAQTVDLALSKNTNILMQKYDQLIRWVLSFFDTFEVLTLQDLIALGDEQSLM